MFEGSANYRAYTGSTDPVNQDLNTSSVNIAIGYLGRASELWWIERVTHEVQNNLDVNTGGGGVSDERMGERVPAIEGICEFSFS